MTKEFSFDIEAILKDIYIYNHILKQAIGLTPENESIFFPSNGNDISFEQNY